MVVLKKSDLSAVEFGQNRTVALQDPENSDYQLCYKVFDLLYIRTAHGAIDLVNTSTELKERQALLSRVIEPVPGRLEAIKSDQNQNSQKIKDSFEKAISLKQEGIIVKLCDSLYQPGGRSKAWVKLKPDYERGYVSDLDLVIIGAYFGSGQLRIGRGLDWYNNITHFLMGLMIKTEDNSRARTGSIDEAEANEVKFEPFCKVGSGLNLNELEILRTKLKNQWVAVSKEDVKTKKISLPSYLNFKNFSSKDFPDAVLKSPKQSIILQIRSAEIINAKFMGFPYTLRFPRVEKIRDDKCWNDCLTVSELKDLVEHRNQNLKIKKRDSDEAFLAEIDRAINMETQGRENGLGGSSGEAQSLKKLKNRLQRLKNGKGVKKFKGDKTKKRKEVLEDFRQTDVSGVEKKSDLLKGHEIVILNCGKKFSKSEIEASIVRNGGRRVQNCLPSTTIALAEVNNFRCKALNRKYGISVLDVKWLMDSIKDQRLMDYLPKYVMYSSKWLQTRNMEKYDEFGDSYLRDMSVEDLQILIKNNKKKKKIEKGGALEPFEGVGIDPELKKFSEGLGKSKNMFGYNNDSRDSSFNLRALSDEFELRYAKMLIEMNFGRILKNVKFGQKKADSKPKESDSKRDLNQNGDGWNGEADYVVVSTMNRKDLKNNKYLMDYVKRVSGVKVVDIGWLVEQQRFQKVD